MSQSWPLTLNVSRLFSVAVFWAVGIPALAGWPAVPLPPESRGEMVAEHMRSNGIEMQASKFVTSESLGSVRAFYQQQWGDAMVENEADGKVILGHNTDTHFITVELSSMGEGVQGTVGIVEVPEQNFEYTPGQGVILPSGSEVLSDVRFLDTPAQPRFVTVLNEHTPYVNRKFYLSRLSPQGWSISGVDRCVSNSARCMVVFEHPDGDRITLFAERKQSDAQAQRVTQVVVQMQ